MSAAEGATLRDQGMELATCAADSRVVAIIDQKIQDAIDSGRKFSANTIRHQLPTSDGHLVGARMNSFAFRRVDGHPVMKRIGTEPSTLASTHHAEVKVWLGWDAFQTLNNLRTTV
ncbi:hypothetical protein Back2_17580 [Nocardioides baekrokdamisoli]|uniref:Uncharacterized protein n=1 Tax=Nocardioides baekrokdamisoli TaxID=1804624 RepID=A0A3G9IUY3_9ACTN|nr:hypothetical protein [Nocardioides baekrokdamisoli]BBH17471.1 hypothetical protein Back2_17580 [Nocardioides baekrokdamisoli]